MYLIFCTSHLYIPTSLTIIKKNGENFSIFTDRQSIYQFFQYMYPTKSVFLLEKKSYTNKITKFLFSPHQEKKKMREFVEGKEIEKAYFFHEGFCQEANWLIKYLAREKYTEIFYVPVARTFSPEFHWKEQYSIKTIAKQINILLTWGYWCHFYKYLNSVYPVMDESFYREIKSREIAIRAHEIDITSEINKILLPESEYPYSGIVWLENTLRLFKVEWSEVSYKDFLEQLLSAFAHDSFIFKGHPDLAHKYGKEHLMKEIPSFIPGNLILNRFSCFVGCISDLMFEAANVGTASISILYLFDMNNQDRERLVKYLRNKNNNILFPKTLPEFVDILKRIWENGKLRLGV